MLFKISSSLSDTRKAYIKKATPLSYVLLPKNIGKVDGHASDMRALTWSKSDVSFSVTIRVHMLSVNAEHQFAY